MYEQYSNDGGLMWSGWINLGWVLKSLPSAAYGPGSIVVMARTGDGSIWQDLGNGPFSGGSPWTGWSWLTGGP